MKLPKIDIPQKPTYIHVADDINFFELFKKIEAENENCFLFESLGQANRSARYSILGFAPEHLISARQNILTYDSQDYEVENPYLALREIIPQNIIGERYAGGLVGNLNYDCINYFEPSVKVKIHDDFPQFMFGVYTDGLVYDTMTNRIFYFYYTNNRLDKIKEIMQKELPQTQTSAHFIGDSLTEEEHAKLVEATKEYIKSGYTFQCEVGFKSFYEINGCNLNIYEKLRQINPSPYMYYLKFGGKKLIGASPELLFSLINGEAETHPLAGTIKRGETELEDKQLARKLLNDQKEIAEHNMLVDMHRNDIGRIARFCTVKIRTLMDIKKYSHVQHIGSEIRGILNPGEDMFSGLASLLPGGVLSGAPKIETVKIIDRQEPDARGPYGGAVGFFGFNGDCMFAVPIRTLFVSGNQAFTQTSSGIVYDSLAYREYDEIKRKLAAMKETLMSFCYDF